MPPAEAMAALSSSFVFGIVRQLFETPIAAPSPRAVAYREGRNTMKGAMKSIAAVLAATAVGVVAYDRSRAPRRRAVGRLGGTSNGVGHQGRRLSHRGRAEDGLQ